MSEADEYPPLLQPGLQRMSVADLKSLVVDKFPLSTARTQLWKTFCETIEELSTLGLRCEIWVDGSFLTEKINPNDIDFVVDFPIEILDNASAKQKEMLEKLSNKEHRRSTKMHSFVMYTTPVGHASFSKSRIQHNQWEKDFGQSYVKKEPKGIAVIGVGQ